MIVKDVHKLADSLRKAFVIARSGRPGPVLVDVTKDVTAAVAEYTYQEPEEVLPSTEGIREEDVASSFETSKRSETSLSLCGRRRNHFRRFGRTDTFAHRLGAPVGDSLMGKGAFPGTDKLYTGMIGMHGTKASNLSVTRCDLLVTIGARFSDRVTGNASKFAQSAKILQIDVDEAEINKNVLVDSCNRGRCKRSTENSEQSSGTAGSPGMDRFGEGIKGKISVEISSGWPDRSFRCGGSIQSHRRGGDHHHRSGTESDVGGSVL